MDDIGITSRKDVKDKWATLGGEELDGEEEDDGEEEKTHQAQELRDGLCGRLDVGGIGLGLGVGLIRPAGWG